MKRDGKAVLIAALGLVAYVSALAAAADPPSHPYQAIPDRNVFALHDPPPVDDKTNAAPKEPPLKLTLTGIMTITGNKRALLKAPPLPAKAGQPAKTEQFFMLTEGQRDGEVEVLQIDENAGSVKVNNSGIEVTLTFEKDGMKPPSAPGGPAGPGGPGGPGGVPPPGGMAKPAGTQAGIPPIPAPALASASGTLPSRTLRSIQKASASSSGVTTTGAQSQTAGTSIIKGTRGANVSVTPVRAQPGVLKSWPPETHLTPEEAAILLEAQRQKSMNDPNAAPLPPSELSPPTPAAQ